MPTCILSAQLTNNTDFTHGKHFGIDTAFYISLFKSYTLDQAVETMKLAAIREPEICGLFSRILNETQHHCEMINHEYMRLTHMADRAEQGTHVWD